MEIFKREDFIYLRMNEDYVDKDGIEYNKGEILRYRKEWLIENITGRFFDCVFDYKNKLIFEKNSKCDENDILYHKIYKSITVSKDRECNLYLWPGDYFYLNDWLFKHIDKRGMYFITNAQRKIIPDKRNSNKLIELMEGYPSKEINARISFFKGEVIDFSDPAVITLFYDINWLKFLTKAEVLFGKEKEELFNEDFSNAIYAQRPSTASLWKDDPNRDLHEYHYFKIKDDIQVKNKDALKEKFGIRLPYSANIIYDDNGFIKWIYTETDFYDSSSREIEQLILKFANRVSIDEAYKCHKKLIVDYINQEEEKNIKWMKKIEEENLKLQKLYEPKKNDPSYFPGVNGYFVHNDDSDKDLKKEKYSLQQIKEFYKKLKLLDPSVVSEMYFYGGTIPYILNNASESRDFGDIDIFVPVSAMEKLREEMAKQDDFLMIYDSKPLAQFCHLTSRIQKESTELVNKPENAIEFLSLMAESMNSSLDKNIINVDQKGDVYDPFEEFFNKFRPYYNKPQDFGFKAKLFGINISVFPIYQYKNDILAKSFNINEMYRFLLGVKVLNDTNIADFVKNVKLYDSLFKVIPLEYTLVSKKSAVDEHYSFRFDKDKEDIDYILAHRKELGIDDEKIQVILSKYPDYSISIAYQVNEDGTTTTMNGETYKELVLTNRNIS